MCGQSIILQASFLLIASDYYKVAGSPFPELDAEREKMAAEK
jgi:hypothetical protein